MELQSQVRVYNEAMGVKGAKGRLIQIHDAGYYEVALEVKENYHEVLLPISATVILAAVPIPESESIPVERF
jgi:hypothetical protein